MNNISLAQHINKNQASWNDDPFDLKDKFAGVAILNHERNLSNYAEELVSHYAKYVSDQYELSLDMLPEFEKNELVRLYLEYTDRDTSECVYGNDFTENSDYTCALLAMLKDDCKANREAFAEITRKNIIIYYSESLQDILDTSCKVHLDNCMEEGGYHSQIDWDNGDVVWSKSR